MVRCRQTYPALPIFTYVASEKRPSRTSASNQSFRSPAKEPENCVSGSMLCCLFGVEVSVCHSGLRDTALEKTYHGHAIAGIDPLVDLP